MVLGAEDFRLCVGRRELPTLGQHASGSWGFYLGRKNGWTRLLVRGSGGVVGHAAFDIPHFVMEQKMMRGIRDRAQQLRRHEVHDFIEHYESAHTVATS